MHSFSKNRLSARRRTTNRRNFLRLERLENRLALATAPIAMNDFYHDLVDQPLDVAAPGILANDTADAGSSLAAGLFSGPSHGTLSMAEDGSFQYQPEAGYLGLDSFLYFANDGASDSMLAAVTISIGDGGPPPDAADDSFSVDEDGVLGVALSDGVLANDTAADGLTLSSSLLAGPSNGTLTLGEDGSLTYVPNANFNGTDSFTYTATDSAGDSSVATATINVNPVNDKPTAANDAFATSEDTSLTVDAAGGLLTNDADVDGDTLTPTVTSQPLHGTVTVNPDGSFSYTPEANYNGLDGFSYLVSDGTTTSDVASATITIGPVNDLPVGANDEYTTPEDAPLTIAAPGVLVNDTDVDGDALSSILVNPPQHGTVTLGGDGALLYTPDANFNGVDGFSYLANDGSADSDAAAVTINVTPVNDAPASAADAYTTDEDAPLAIDAAAGVLANDSDADGDSLTATLVAGPANGTVTLNADGSFNYVPNANFNGSDSFTYTAGDGSVAGPETTVSLTVNPVNDPPAGTGDSFHTNEDVPLTIDAPHGVLANDTDPDADPLTATLVTGPANGTLTLNADGSFNYVPNANWNGSDSFVYQAGDGTLTSEATTATIDVCEVNDAPTTADDAFSLDQGTTLTVDAATGVLVNDSDIDGDTLSAAVVSGPASGTLTLNTDGSFSYVPNAGFSGADSFVYQASDGSLQTPATVSLTVNPVAQAPVVAIDNYSTVEDVPLAVAAGMGVLANDVNPDGGAMTAEVVTGPAHGTLALNADGSFSFSPEANWHGTDSFTYKAVSNGQEMISSANVVVEPLNDAPSASDDDFTIDPAATPPAVSNVLANDSDIDGDPLTATLVSGPAHGTLSLNGDGTFNYAPQAGFSGDDSFRYQSFDGKANSNVATVTLHVTAGTSEAPPPVETPPPAENQRPLAANDVFTTPQDAPLSVPAASGLLGNDSDPEGGPITASLFSDPLHGSVVLASDGSFNYTPTSGYSGMDAFLYRVSDGQLWSPLAAVTIHVTPASGPDEAPVPAPTPAPAPEPNPDPQPCHPHVCCEVSDNVMNALAATGHGQHHAQAVDAVFGHHRGWRS
jgi:VCBS repeat-containing protein